MTVPLTVWLLLFAVFVEPVLLLAVAPRITRRMVHRDASAVFNEHMRPGVSELTNDLWVKLGRELSDMHAGLNETLAEVIRRIPATVPTAEAVALAVRDTLVAAQAEAQAKGGDPTAAFREIVRSELEAALSRIDAEPPSAPDAARSLGDRGVAARYAYAAREEQFRAGIQQAGVAAVLAVDELEAQRPKTYKAYANQGLAGAEALRRDAQALGIKLPGLNGASAGGNVHGLPAGARFL